MLTPVFPVSGYTHVYRPVQVESGSCKGFITFTSAPSRDISNEYYDYRQSRAKSEAGAFTNVHVASLSS